MTSRDTNSKFISRHAENTIATCLLILCVFFHPFAEARNKDQTPPGAQDFSRSLHKKLLKAVKRKSGSYLVRTAFKHDDGSPKYTNRLILEDSPYLLQHAHNPVNWYPWGDEAFADAKKQGKAVFLSVGYSTCHWCHVMEEESFDNETIAALMNENFINIKVDREQLPEIDEIYMAGTRIISGRSGWPMSTFMSDEGKPFYAGTYFDPTAFTKVIFRVKTLWSSDREKLLSVADRVTKSIQQTLSVAKSADSLDESTLAQATSTLLERSDLEKGGFKGAPKFPNESSLLFLLTRFELTGDSDILKTVDVTLAKMARGGIYDHVGGGFHRYATDEDWLIPHFEKMLYNQAQLLRVYARMAMITSDPYYKMVARETADYVLRDMRSSENTFYSATDADSEGREGAFFLWQHEQISALLPPNEAKLISEIYGVDSAANFDGANILHIEKPLKTIAQKNNLSLKELIEKLSPIKDKLNAARNSRVAPLKDEKVIAAWNGLMITGLAEAALYLDEPNYLDAAREAALQLWKHSKKRNNTLQRIRLNGSSHTDGVLEDYAYFIEALITLYDITSDEAWLKKAEVLTDKMIAVFRDSSSGGLYVAGEESRGPKIAKSKTILDSALPSASAVSYRNLLRLERRSSSDNNYKDLASALLANSAGQIKKAPSAHASFLLALSDNYLRAAKQRAYLSSGVGSIDTKAIRSDDNTVALSLDITLNKGWHVNANEPRQDYLVGTKLALADFVSTVSIEAIDYPQSKEWRVEGFKEDLKVFDNSFEIKAQLNLKEDSYASRSRILPLKITLQACDDSRCLPPETLRLNSVF